MSQCAICERICSAGKIVVNSSKDRTIQWQHHQLLFWNLKAFFTADVFTCHSREIAGVTMSSIISVAPVSQQAQHQDPETEAVKWNSAIIHSIIYTSAFPTVTRKTSYNMICLGSGINPGTSNDDELNWPASCLILSSLGLNALHRCFLLRSEVGGAWIMSIKNRLYMPAESWEEI